MKIFDKECFILFPEQYDGNIKIYRGYPKILFEDHKKDYTYYKFKFDNCEFDICIMDNNPDEVQQRIAYISTSNFNGENKIIFSLSKNNILKYYENQLHAIKHILDIRKTQLKESFKAIENQKHILYTNPDSLFIDYENASTNI